MISTAPRWRRLNTIPLTSNASLAAQTFRVKDVDTSAPPRRRREMSGEVALHADFERAGTGASIESQSKNADDTDSINRFPDSGFAMDIMRQSIGSWPSVAG